MLAKRSGATQVHCLFSNPAQPDVTIGLHSTGLPVGAGGEVLEKLLNGTSAKLLFSNKWEQKPGWQPNSDREKAAAKLVKELTGVLDPDSVGDNQLSNSKKPPDPLAPITQLSKLEVRTVSGKPVLLAEGYFENLKTGDPQKYFSVVYAPMKTSAGVEIHIAALQANNNTAFTANKSVFQKSLASIEWQ